MTAQPIALLRDDFTNNTQDPVWASSSVTGSATKAETGGQAILTLPSATAGSHLAAYTTSGTYDLTGDSFYFNIGTMVATGVAATAYFQLYVVADGTSQLLWRQVSNVITARYITTAGVDTQVYTAAWSAATYKYLRIRESAGTIFWDSSTNGTTWTNRASVANPFGVTALYVQFAAACGNVASPGSLRLDDVNLILPAPSSTWRETTADWSITNRLRPVTLASDGGKQGVLVTADTMDSSRVLGGTLRYFGGPIGSTSGGYLALTEYASLALAQASPFQVPIDGRVDLPAMVDARYMRLYHRSTDASAHTVYEFVPRRIVQAEDIEAESIKAINISAGAVTADKIFVLTLAAITANIGGLNIDTGGYLWQGTGTAASPTTGLKIFNSGGVGKLSTYNTGVEQVTLDTDGKLKAGAGKAVLDANGITILTSGAYVPEQAYRIGDASGGVYGTVDALYVAGSAHTVRVRSASVASELSTLELDAYAPSTKTATIDMQLQSGLTFYSTFKAATDGATSTVNISAQGSAGRITLASPVTASFGLNMGSATGASTGQIATSDSIGIGDAVQSNIRGYFKGADATSSNYALFANSSAGTNLFWVRNDGAVLIAKSGGAVGFYGSTPASKPTVTGSRGGNAALASLLTSLAGLGLLVDSSS
jgi:hypothetical protein